MIQLRYFCLAALALIARPGSAGLMDHLNPVGAAMNHIDNLQAATVEDARKQIQADPADARALWLFAWQVKRIISSGADRERPDLNKEALLKEGHQVLGTALKAAKDPLSLGQIYAGKGLLHQAAGDLPGAERWLGASVKQLPSDPGFGALLDLLAEEGKRADITAWCRYAISRQSGAQAMGELCQACIEHGDGLAFAPSLTGPQFLPLHQAALHAPKPGSLRVEIVNHSLKPCVISIGEPQGVSDEGQIYLDSHAKLVRFLNPGDTVCLIRGTYEVASRKTVDGKPIYVNSRGSKFE